MPIFICKNCGNLTEAERGDGLSCSTCGASLDGIKPKEEDKPLHRAQPPSIPSSSEQITARRAEAIRRPSRPPSTEQKPPSTRQESPETPTTGQATQQQAPIELPVTKESEPPSAPPAIAGPPSAQSHIFIESTHEIMEVYENENLVLCPQCSYGCDPAWDKCPICEAEISNAAELKKVGESDFTFDEEKLKEKLIPCPKCNYFCDPSWNSCPICQTELRKPE